MTMHVKAGGSWRSVNGLYVKVSGTWQPVKQGYVKTGASWQTFYVSLTASATDAEGYASDFAGSGLVTSNATTLTVTGGSGNYSYSWTKVSGEDFTISNNLMQNPYWYEVVVDGPHYATWKVTVTDNTYGVTAEDTITVMLQWANLN